MTVMKGANCLPEGCQEKLVPFFYYGASCRRVPRERVPRDLAPFAADHYRYHRYKRGTTP